MCAKVVNAWHHARAQGGQEEPAADSEQLLRGFAMCFLTAQALRESERADVVASATGLLTPRKGSAAAAAASGEGGGADATPAILRQSLRWQEEAEQEEKGRLAAEREAAKAERLAQKQRERESAREAQAEREAAPRRHQEELAAQAVKKVAAGFSHCAAAAASGELYCWGSNYTGCCGAPYPLVQFCYEPFNVPCIYAKPVNLALGKPASQSTVYNGQDAHLAVDGNVEGGDASTCNSTQSESQPWWDVDLGDYCCVDTIRVWNRTDEPHDPSFDQETFRERLFPAYVHLVQRGFVALCQQQRPSSTSGHFLVPT